MPRDKQHELTEENKKKIEEKLVLIFKDIYFNSFKVLEAKKESDRISEEIRNFILSYSGDNEINEADLLMQSKEKGLELVDRHDLVFFDEKINKNLIMRAFLIPGMKVDITEENEMEKVTEDDLQAVDHELCISFKVNNSNQFVKLGNLLDIKVKLAKELSDKSGEEKEITLLIRKNNIFKETLLSVLNSAKAVLQG